MYQCANMISTWCTIKHFFHNMHMFCTQKKNKRPTGHGSLTWVTKPLLTCRCYNIFPILSSQLMKISSFEQFLVLKKNIWAWQSMKHDHLNKLSITFQQKDQCEIWWKLAKFVSEESWFYTCKQHSGREIL